MNVEARVATDADLEVLIDLLDIGVGEQDEARGGPIWAVRETRPRPAGESFAADVNAADRVVVIGQIDGTAVGFATVGRETLRDGSTLGVIDEMMVHPGAREVGVGEAMMDVLLDQCRSWGCFGVDSHALPGNRLTKNFFESFGFTARLLVVHHPLATAADDPSAL